MKTLILRRLRFMTHAAWLSVTVMGFAGEAAFGQLTVTINNPSNGTIFREPMWVVGYTVTDSTCQHRITNEEMSVTNSTFGTKTRTSNYLTPSTQCWGMSPIEELYDGSQTTITLKVTCVKGHTQSASVTVGVDCRLLYYVDRMKTDNSLRVKWWGGSGWNDYGYGWMCGTVGMPHDNNEYDPKVGWPCPHTDPHRFCTNGDHPPRLGTNPGTGDPNADEVTSQALEASDANTAPCDLGNAIGYWADAGGAIMGHWKIPLPDKAAPCGCSRHYLRIHGGGGAWSVALHHDQDILNTHGCLRMLNGCPLHEDSNLQLLSEKHNHWHNLRHRIFIYVAPWTGPGL